MKRLIMGMAIGAGAMYLLDPDNGAERRRRLLGFYSENKDTFQDYAQTASQTAVTVGRTAAESAATVSQTVGTVAEKATEITGKAGKSSTKGDAAIEKSAAALNNGSSTNVDSLLENRNVTKKTRGAGKEEAPGMGGSLSS